VSTHIGAFISPFMPYVNTYKCPYFSSYPFLAFLFPTLPHPLAAARLPLPSSPLLPFLYLPYNCHFDRFSEGAMLLGAA